MGGCPTRDEEHRELRSKMRNEDVVEGKMSAIEMM
jgi:hypothetical protein